jgi:hypothetical protein
MYLAAKGPGFYLKLPGKIDADQQTGQLTATFTDTRSCHSKNCACG